MNSKSRQVQVVVAAPADAQAAIKTQTEGVAHVVATTAQPAEALAAARQHAAQVVVFFLDQDPQRVLDHVREVSGQGLAVIVVSRERNPDNILVAMRSGAKDFAYLDDAGDDVRRALRDLPLAGEAVSAARRGKLITLFSAKGGSGATTIATNLAGAFAAQQVEGRKARVVLVDVDTEMGDVLVFLDMRAPFSFQEVLSNMHRLDAELLSQSLARHHSGAYVLSQTDYVEDGRELSAADLGSVLSFLRQHFDFVVVDGPRDFSENALVALDKSDTIVVTMTQDIPALKNAARCLRLFGRLGYEGDRVRLLLNRYRGGGQLTPDAISDALQHKVSWTVSNDFPAVIRAVNEGKLLVNTAAGSETAKDIFELLGSFLDVVPEKKRGLFSLWGRK